MLGRIALIVAILYLVLCVYAFFAAEGMIFQPQPSSYRDTPEILKVPTATGHSISALYLPNPSARYTLLVSHGNAEDLGDDRDWLELLRSAGYGVFAYDYEGYGTSEGKPTEKAIYSDVAAAYEYLKSELHVPPDGIIVMGRSVGSGPATYLAARRPVAALILQSPFVSAFRVITNVPLMPFDKFRNDREIRSVHCPVLVLHGSADTIIPPWHGKKVFDLANAPKKFVMLQSAGHNDVEYAARSAYIAALRDFRETLPISPASLSSGGR